VFVFDHGRKLKMLESPKPSRRRRRRRFVIQKLLGIDSKNSIRLLKTSYGQRKDLFWGRKFFPLGTPLNRIRVSELGFQ